MRGGGQPCTAYYELDTLGNVRRLRAGRRLGTGPALPSDLGGYAYTAFGKALPADAATPAPTIPTAAGSVALNQQLRWQSRWFSDIAGGLYDFRARTWSPELAAFLQPDDFRYLYTQRAGIWTPELGGQFAETTLWSWPGQNPIRYRDPSGRLAGSISSVAATVAIGAAMSALATISARSYYQSVLGPLLHDLTPIVVDEFKEADARIGEIVTGFTVGAVTFGNWVAETSTRAHLAKENDKQRSPEDPDCTEHGKECFMSGLGRVKLPTGDSVCSACLRMCQSQGFWPSSLPGGRRTCDYWSY